MLGVFAIDPTMGKVLVAFFVALPSILGIMNHRQLSGRGKAGEKRSTHRRFGPWSVERQPTMRALMDEQGRKLDDHIANTNMHREGSIDVSKPVTQ